MEGKTERGERQRRLGWSQKRSRSSRTAQSIFCNDILSEHRITKTCTSSFDEATCKSSPQGWFCRLQYCDEDLILRVLAPNVSARALRCAWRKSVSHQRRILSHTMHLGC
jgi:hypothetical protein